MKIFIWCGKDWKRGFLFYDDNSEEWYNKYKKGGKARVDFSLAIYIKIGYRRLSIKTYLQVSADLDALVSCMFYDRHCGGWAIVIATYLGHMWDYALLSLGRIFVWCKSQRRVLPGNQWRRIWPLQLLQLLQDCYQTKLVKREASCRLPNNILWLLL